MFAPKLKLELHELNRHLNFRAKENFIVNGQNFKLQGRLLYSWPYEWIPLAKDSLHQVLHDEMETWLGRHLTRDNMKSNLIRDSIIGAITLTPTYWSEEAEYESDEKLSQTKLLIVCKYVYTCIYLDDTCEIHVNKADRPGFSKILGHILLKIFQFFFLAPQDLTASQLYKEAVNISPNVGEHLELVLDIALELKNSFQTDKKSTKHFAQLIRYFYEAQIWCGRDNCDHLLNSKLQMYLRHFTSGFSGMQEFIFLLEGLKLPGLIRRNVYWNRCFHLAGYLPAIVNDIFGLEREAAESTDCDNRVENVILLQVESGSSYETALASTLRDHDNALREFRDIVMYLERSPEDLYELDVGQREAFFNSVAIMSKYVSGIVQTHVGMPRYKGLIQVEIE